MTKSKRHEIRNEQIQSLGDEEPLILHISVSLLVQPYQRTEKGKEIEKQGHYMSQAH
jgi:hypothetical protein